MSDRPLNQWHLESCAEFQVCKQPHQFVVQFMVVAVSTGTWSTVDWQKTSGQPRCVALSMPMLFEHQLDLLAVSAEGILWPTMSYPPRWA